MMDRRGAFRFLLPLLVVWCALAALLLSNFIFLERSAEQTDLYALAAMQQKSGGLYQSAFYEDTEEYKIALYDTIKPEIVVVGSSRTLQFRPYAVTATFLTVGAPTAGMAAIHERVAALLSIHRPKVLLLGLDFWWFNPQRNLPSLTRWRQLQASRKHEKDSKSRALALPVSALFDGRLSPREYVDVLFQAGPRDGFGPRYGLAARLRNRGFFLDGSYLYDLALLTGNGPEGKAALEDHLKRVADGRKGFEHATALDERQFALLQRTLDLLKKAGVPTVLFMPPVAPPMIERMAANQEKFSYISRLQNQLTQLKVPFFDFHDPAAINSETCEFLDGMHAGDIASLRMVRRMAVSQNSSLAPYVDLEAADRLIEDFQGRAAYVLDRAGYVEADILGRDCPRPASTRNRRPTQTSARDSR